MNALDRQRVENGVAEGAVDGTLLRIASAGTEISVGNNKLQPILHAAKLEEEGSQGPAAVNPQIANTRLQGNRGKEVLIELIGLDFEIGFATFAIAVKVKNAFELFGVGGDFIKGLRPEFILSCLQKSWSL